MAQRVTVQCCDSESGVLQLSEVFELFDGRLPVMGAGGLQEVFGTDSSLRWEDSCLVSVGLDGLSRRKLPDGATSVRLLLQRVKPPGPEPHSGVHPVPSIWPTPLARQMCSYVPV